VVHVASSRRSREDEIEDGHVDATSASDPSTPTITPSFKFKTECIPLCVPRSIFTHRATNSEINSITSVYYNVSLIQNLLQDQEVYIAEQNTTPQAEDRGSHA
jgi:hypothetical protein